MNTKNKKTPIKLHRIKNINNYNLDIDICM